MNQTPEQLLTERLKYHQEEFGRIKKRFARNFKENYNWDYLTTWSIKDMIREFELILKYKEALNKIKI